MIVFEGYGGYPKVGGGYPKVGDVITWGTRTYNFIVESIDHSEYHLVDVRDVGHRFSIIHEAMHSYVGTGALEILS